LKTRKYYSFEPQLLTYCSVIPLSVDDGGFFFSLATAPAHVEDKLRDAWLEFAEEDAAKDTKATGDPDIRSGNTEGMGVSLKEEAEAAQKFGGQLEPSKEEAMVEKKTTEETGTQNPEALGQTGEGGNGSPDTPTSGKGDSSWEVLSDSSDRDRAEGSSQEYLRPEKTVPEDILAKELSGVADPADVEGLPKTPRRRQRNTTATLQFNPPRQVKKFGKVAMEAMLRGIDKISEVIEDSGEESANVAAWQNAFIP
jgi:hypothetical protein